MGALKGSNSSTFLKIIVEPTKVLEIFIIFMPPSVTYISFITFIVLTLTVQMRCKSSTTCSL